MLKYFILLILCCVGFSAIAEEPSDLQLRIDDLEMAIARLEGLKSELDELSQGGSSYEFTLKRMRIEKFTREAKPNLRDSGLFMLSVVKGKVLGRVKDRREKQWISQLQIITEEADSLHSWIKGAVDSHSADSEARPEPETPKADSLLKAGEVVIRRSHGGNLAYIQANNLVRLRLDPEHDRLIFEVPFKMWQKLSAEGSPSERIGNLVRRLKRGFWIQHPELAPDLWVFYREEGLRSIKFDIDRNSRVSVSLDPWKKDSRPILGQETGEVTLKDILEAERRRESDDCGGLLGSID